MGSGENARAISFYERSGFRLTQDKKFEEGTTAFLVRMKIVGKSIDKLDSYLKNSLKKSFFVNSEVFRLL